MKRSCSRRIGGALCAGITVLFACTPTSGGEGPDDGRMEVARQTLSYESEGGAALVDWYGTTVDVCFQNGTSTTRQSFQDLISAEWGTAVGLTISWSGDCPSPVGQYQVPVFFMNSGYNGGVGKSGKGKRLSFTGYLPNWTGSTSYAVGNRVKNDNKSYICTQAGTSGSTGPTGIGMSIVDNQARWNFECNWGVMDCHPFTGVFDVDPNWSPSTTPVQMFSSPDHTFIRLHEFGHVLGFSHNGYGTAYTALDPTSIMEAPNTLTTTLTRLDRIGAEIAYPFGFTRQVTVGPAAAFATASHVVLRSGSDFISDWTYRGAADAVFGSNSVHWKVNGTDITPNSVRLPISGSWVATATSIELSFTDFTPFGGRSHTGSLTLPKPLLVDNSKHTALVYAVTTARLFR